MHALKKSSTLLWLTLLILIFSPIADFICCNYYQASFSFVRCLGYFLILIISAYAIIALTNKMLGKKHELLIALVIGLGVMVVFNHYAIEPLLQKWLQNNYNEKYLIIPDLLSVVFAYLFYKSRPFHYGLLCTVFCSMIISFASIKMQETHFDALSIKEYPEIASVSSVANKNTPNVYFIIPDAFGGPELFNKRSDKKLTIHHELESRNFTVVHNAYSNGTVTRVSLPQVYAMNYLFENKDLYGPKKAEAYEKLYIYDNPVIREFRRRGYKFYRLADGMIGQCVGIEDKCMKKQSFIKIQDTVFADRTLLPRNLKNDGKGGILGLAEINEFIPLLPDPKEGPFFLIGHFTLPHQPYRFGEHCTALPYKTFSGSLYAFLEATPGEGRFNIYRGQALCAQKLVLNMVDSIIQKDSNAIVIVQADHGTQTFDYNIPPSQLKQQDFIESFNIVYAFYGPESLTKYLYNGLPPVNTFRLVFAWLDNQEPQLLPYRGFYEYPHKNKRKLEIYEWKGVPVQSKEKVALDSQHQ